MKKILTVFYCFFLTSSISAILSGTIGIHYGHVLIHFKVTNFTSMHKTVLIHKWKLYHVLIQRLFSHNHQLQKLLHKTDFVFRKNFQMCT